MYEDGSKKINFNWGSLAIKLAILAVIIFIICFIITKLTGNKSNSTSTLAISNNDYITNITSMKDAAFEYFTPSKLPENIGGTERLTLSEMLNQKLLIDFTNDGDTCDIDSSYIQATKTADGNYALKISLDCGDKSDFIITTIEEQSCVIDGNCNETTNTDVVINDDEKTNDTNTNNNDNNNSNSSNNSNTNSGSSSTTTTGSSSNTSNKVTTTVKTTVNIKISCSINGCTTSKPSEPSKPSKPIEPEDPTPDTPEDPDKDDTTNDEKTKYYKLVKWSDWEEGYSSKSNTENKKETVTTYDYCEYTDKTYYTTSWVSASKSSQNYNYEIELQNIDARDIVDNEISITDKSYFSSSTTDYKKYMDQTNALHMTGNVSSHNINISSASAFRNSSLTENNFNYAISSLYKDGNSYKTLVTINYRNSNGVSRYYANNIGSYIYFVPLKFTVTYVDEDDCTRDTYENRNDYKGYYRTNKDTESIWYHRTATYKWSTNKNLSGWDYTGEYEYR